MRIHPLTMMGSTEAPALPNASHDAPKPRLSAFELFVSHLSVYRVCFGCKSLTTPQRFYPSTFHSLSQDFFFMLPGACGLFFATIVPWVCFN